MLLCCGIGAPRGVSDLVGLPAVQRRQLVGEFAAADDGDGGHQHIGDQMVVQPRGQRRHQLGPVIGPDRDHRVRDPRQRAVAGRDRDHPRPARARCDGDFDHLLGMARLRKDQARLSRYPTINLKGSLSQAVNGRNPNNNEDDGFYNSIMIEASSNFYQGGAVRSQARAASYAEEAARAQVNTVYLDVLDQVRLIREQIENKQRQMNVLAQRRETTVRTKELYQEQYKLGTPTVVDLLNAEQAIHSAAQEIESARYDIYSAIVQYIQVTGRTRDIYALNRISIQGFEVQP